MCISVQSRKGPSLASTIATDEQYRAVWQTLVSREIEIDLVWTSRAFELHFKSENRSFYLFVGAAGIYAPSLERMT